MKIGILTSSRADYGIYLPLLKKMKTDSFFNIEVIAFGTHMSKFHGYTVKQIEDDGYKKIHKISALISNDDEQAIATSYALTALKFADFWQTNKFDLIFSIGDRFEMNAAVQAGIPFGVKFAHVHGGETTLGAFDNIYRHQITLASSIHFSAAKLFSSKIINLIGDSDHVHTIGALSLNDISEFKPLKKADFYNRFNILQDDFALITFHPETISPNLNISHANEMRMALEFLTTKLFLVITMPNADTLGSIFRNEIVKLINQFPDKITVIENFGKENYFTAMYYSKLLIGNTSSGILEAASFEKYVVNVGDRQKGRLQSDNIYNAKFQKDSIVDAVSQALTKGSFKGNNKYYQNDSASQIISLLKSFYAGV